MGRAPCCEKVGLKRGPWTPEEDEKLVSFIKENGHGSWRALPKKAGLLRCGKSCRLRWTNYLRPDIKRGEFSASEENVILQLHALLGNRWSAIASHLPQRTDNEIKNYWNTHLKKKLVKMGLDPTTHKPLADSAVLLMNNGSSAAMAANENSGSVKLIDKSSNNKSSGGALNSGNDFSTTKAASNSSCIMNDQIGVSSAASLLLRGPSPCNMKGSSATMHLTQWESVRLEAEARLTQEAKMRAKGVWSNIKHTPCSTNSSAAGPACTASLSILGHHELQIHAGSHDSCAGAASSTCKARSAVELMHALHNWEKSLQGQAGVLWPESWRVAANASAHSCCSHSESSSSSSPPAAPDHVQQAAAATSSVSLCSLDSTRTPSRTAEVGSAPMAGTSPPTSKLSWSDALMPPKYPSSSSPKPTSDHICRVESSSRGSFSSLMLDAVLGRSLVAQGPIGVVHSPKLEVNGYGDYKEDEILGEESNHAAEHVDKHHLDEASNVSAVTGEMLQDDSASTDEDNDDNDGENERSLSADGTSDLFRDLPRLKRDATTRPVSFTALLSEEISDYWSNMVLKEQIASPTIQISF